MFHYPRRAIDPTQQDVHCSDDHDVNYWSERLNFSAEELRSTAREVGEKLVDIEASVRQRKRIRIDSFLPLCVRVTLRHDEICCRNR
jgi:hypothetical protein